VLLAQGALLVTALSWAVAMRKQWRAHVLLLWPLSGILALYVFLVLSSALTFMRVSVPYNVSQLLAEREPLPVAVYRMDIVSRELGLYLPQPVAAAHKPEQLPQQGRYVLLVSAPEWRVLRDTLPQAVEVAQGNWAIHKTGTLPRFLRLARGEVPLDDIRILEVDASR
jgi:hypothetical protein